MSKFIKLTVTRKEGTELYFKVDDSAEPSDILNSDIVKEATKLKGGDWDNHGWEETLEVEESEEVDKSEAEDYSFIDLTTEPDKEE